MIWAGLLLLGFGITDLLFSIRPMRHVPEAIGAAAVVVAGLLADLTQLREVGLLLVVGAIVVAWGQAVTRGFAPDGRAWVALAVFGGGLSLALAVSPLEVAPQGLIGDWLDRTPLTVVAGLGADRALLLLGVMLAQLSTGNVVVRLVLTATGTVNPARGQGRSVPSYRLKGGRLLGPMERVFIVGLGLAGQLTAAAIVVAAKGLLRWPELQAARDDGEPGPGIHAVTEYFLVGSFVSWLLALGSLVLLA